MNVKVEGKPIGAILFQYDLFPEKIESYGKVKKVQTARGIFALKETVMTEDEMEWFLHVYERFERVGFRYLVPIIPTKYGKLVIRVNERVFYLMPWFEEYKEFQSSMTPEEAIIEILAKLHKLTEKDHACSEAVLEESYDALKKRWTFRRLEMEKYVEEMESNTYLSPFELAFLTHYQQSLYLADEAENHLTNWLKLAKEKKSYRTVLCHGRPSKKHACFDKFGSAYFLNVERAVIDTPARDLALLFRSFFQSRPWDEVDGRHWLQMYERHFPLYDEEKHLFMSYLSFPESVYQSVETYQKKRGTKSEAQAVIILERKVLTMNRTKRFARAVFHVD